MDRAPWATSLSARSPLPKRKPRRRPPASLRTLPHQSGSGFGSGLGLGPGSAAAASGAESTLAPEAVLAARQHLSALIPLFVNRTLELYAALGPHPTTIQSLPRAPRVVHLRRAPARGGRDGGEAVGHASRRHLPRRVGGKSADAFRAASAIRVHGALGDGASVPHALSRVFPLERGGMRVPSRARGARRRRLELPSSSLARPPRFYVSTAGLARGEVSRLARWTRDFGSLVDGDEKVLWRARGSATEVYSHQRWAETKRFRRARASSRRRRHAGSLAARARDPRPTARPPGTSRSSGCTPRPSPHAPTLPRTPRDGSLRPRGARGSLRGGDRYQTRGARRKRSSTFAFVLLLAFVALLAPMVYHHQHKDHPDARDACATSAWSSRSTRITARPITIPINANADNDCRDLKTRRAARWTMWTELKRARGFSREVGAMGSAASAGESCRRRSRMMQRGSRGRWVLGRSRGKEEGAKDGESREDARGAG